MAYQLIPTASVINVLLLITLGITTHHLYIMHFHLDMICNKQMYTYTHTQMHTDTHTQTHNNNNNNNSNNTNR